MFLNITDPMKASYEVEDPEYSMVQLAQTSTRAEVAKIGVDNIYKEREGLNSAIMIRCHKLFVCGSDRISDSQTVSWLPPDFIIVLSEHKIICLVIFVHDMIVVRINLASEAWGIVCLRYEVRDINLPVAVHEALQMQVEAERKKRAAILGKGNVIKNI